MQTYYLEKDILVYGLEVTTFPEGIEEAFNALIGTLSAGEGRACFGLSKLKENGSILYIAAIEQKEKGEAIRHNYTSYLIEKGRYKIKTLENWMEQPEAIKDIFDELMTTTDKDESAYCVEWYKNERQMVCMLKTINR